LTAEEAIAAYGEMLWEQIREVGYPQPCPRDVDAHLNYDREDLRRMTTDELGEVAYELNVAAFAVQDEFNRQKSVAARCQAALAHLVGRSLSSEVYNREDKWMKAARDSPNKKAWDYWQAMQNANTAAARLESQSFRLAEIAKSINNLIFSRR